jgi:hypothetical protein
MEESRVNDAEPDARFAPPPALAPLAPALMMAFWALLGAAAGIKATQGVWHALGWGGPVSVAVPVGGVAGAIAGALLGLITRPRLLVLLTAVFAGASAGAVAGQLAWGGRADRRAGRRRAGRGGRLGDLAVRRPRPTSPRLRRCHPGDG